ncbi:DUF4157 domain-containing protein [Sphingomonas sp.]|uniref:eCIS core domain-containing protein n=1 Tax=Sphingomonas sp. TaxID=28214 RepID=UPI0031D5D01B
MGAPAAAVQARAGPAQQSASPAQAQATTPEIEPERRRSRTQWLSFLGGQGIRPALAVGGADTPDERAADRLAEAVLQVQRSNGLAGASCPECATKLAAGRPEDETCPTCSVRPAPTVRRMPLARAGGASRAGAAAPPSVHRTLARRGTPLSPSTRAYFEPRFGAVLDHVRVHTDAVAAQSAAEVGAKAYAVGSDLVFAEGRYAPGTARGKRLLAHELAHVVLEGDAGLLRRDPDEEVPLTRAQEIAQSRTSPGMISGQARPMTISLWNFGIDHATLKLEHRAVLQELGHLIHAHGTRTLSFRAIGFTDETGPEEHNLDLSRRRAQAVSAVLTPLAGRVRIMAVGEANPAADNATVDGRSRNRRVDLRLSLPPPPIPNPTPEPDPDPDPDPEPDPDPMPDHDPDPDPDPDPPDEPERPPPDDPSFCQEHPILCGLPILPGLPLLSPLICIIAPELCLGAVCLALPELCTIPVIPDPPGGPPKPPDRPERPRPEEAGGPRVRFVPDVAAGNSPSGMPDRIGLRDPVRVTAVVENPPPVTQPITISVSAPHNAAGDATIDGATTASITGTTMLSILGSRMTEAGIGPQLQLGAVWQSDLVGWSNHFAVSTIAENWSVALHSTDVTQYGCAFYAEMAWESDSGRHSHLDECHYVEAVAVDVERGGLQGMGVGGVNDPAEPNPAIIGSVLDHHGTPYRWIRRPGYARVKQLFRIYDARAGSGWVASPASGFIIERIVERDTRNPRCWQLTVKKSGAAVTAYGLSASAGDGAVEHTFHGINCASPPRPPDPPPEPEPEPEPEPIPEPEPEPEPETEPECDRAELSRRVDACIEEARQGAIACTLEAVIPPLGGWGGVGSGIRYYQCLDDVRERLLECDQEAKRDTNCPDQRLAQTDDDEGGEGPARA